MLRLLWKFYWNITGWKVKGTFPRQYKKMILIVAPHTSWKDILVGFAARTELNIEHGNFLGKKELFDGPFGFLFRWLGGKPVDRFSNKGMVEQVAELFANNQNFILALAPEGTRKRVDKLRTGFYHIAKRAAVPILPVGFDFKHKLLVLGNPLFVSDDEAEDLKKIIAFFSTIEGKIPANDLRHLKVPE